MSDLGTGQVDTAERYMVQIPSVRYGKRPVERSIADAMKLAQRVAFRITPRNSQGLGWEIIHEGALDIVEKNGGLDTTPPYIRLVPAPHPRLVDLPHRRHPRPHPDRTPPMPAPARRRNHPPHSSRRK